MNFDPKALRSESHYTKRCRRQRYSLEFDVRTIIIISGVYGVTSPRAQRELQHLCCFLYGPVAYESHRRVLIRLRSRLFPAKPSIPHIASAMPANTTTDAAAFSNKSYDVLVVGGGTAGLALAAR